MKQDRRKYSEILVINIYQDLFVELITVNHKRIAYTDFWTKAPPGRKKKFPKEEPVMFKKSCLSIHIELYIIYPFPNNKY